MNIETQRMRWRCRRGLLELDIVLERFVSSCYEQLTVDQQHIFNNLLDRTDNDLLDMIIGRTPSQNDELRELLMLMRNPPADFALVDAVLGETVP